MRQPTPKSDSGIALIMVMISVVALTILAAEFAIAMKVETRLAQNANAQSDLLWLGRSGVERARWILGQEMTIAGEPYDALNQVWAGGSGSLATQNSPLAGITLDNYELGAGKFSLKIVDLERKANINSAPEPILTQAMALMSAEATDSSTVVNSILDWIDQDKNARSSGAEDQYYQSLDPPYHAKNAPIDDISELLLIRGVTSEIYWGMSASNHPPAAFQKKLGRLRADFSEMSQYSVGLHDLFTPISSGRININTASSEVLQLIPFIDENIAARIIEIRSEEEGPDGPRPVGSPGKELLNVLTAAGLSNPQTSQQAARFLDVRSRTFEVTVDAELGGAKRRFTAILGRNSPRDIQILSFRWK